MADEPVIKSGVDFLNHVRRVLDASLQRWEFHSVALELDTVVVKFLGTGTCVQITQLSQMTLAISQDRALEVWLTARLNGQVRDVAGNLSSSPATNRPQPWQPGQWLVATADRVGWSMCHIRKGELYLIESATGMDMTVGGLSWCNKHSLFRLATAEEVSQKLTAIYHRIEKRLEQSCDTTLRDVWFGAKEEASSCCDS